MSLQKNKQCLDCRAEISKGAQRCRSCARKVLWENQAFRDKVLRGQASSFRARKLGLESPPGKNKKFCPDCGVEISPVSHRCRRCAALTRWQNSERRTEPKLCVDCGRQIKPEATRCHRCAGLARWQDPEYRKRMTEATLARWQDPEFRRKRAETIQARRKQRGKQRARAKQPNLCSNCGCEIHPDATRCRKCAGRVTSERLKAQWRDPEYRRERVEYMKAQWQDPEFHKKRLEALERGRQR